MQTYENARTEHIQTMWRSTNRKWLKRQELTTDQSFCAYGKEKKLHRKKNVGHKMQTHKTKSFSIISRQLAIRICVENYDFVRAEKTDKEKKKKKTKMSIACKSTWFTFAVIIRICSIHSFILCKWAWSPKANAKSMPFNQFVGESFSFFFLNLKSVSVCQETKKKKRNIEWFRCNARFEHKWRAFWRNRNSMRGRDIIVHNSISNGIECLIVYFNRWILGNVRLLKTKLFLACTEWILIELKSRRSVNFQLWNY